MIVIPPHARIFVALEPVDFRNGIKGLGQVCTRVIREDPKSGAIFVFKNKSRISVKILVYDGEAFWLLLRRLSRGKIRWWPIKEGISTSITTKELQTLLMNGNPVNAEFSDDWKKLIR